MASPVANFLVTPTFLSVNFTDQSTNSPTTWSWDFGDPSSGSNSSASQNPTHTFSSPGKYLVKLTVTNNDGSNSLQREILVSNIPILPVTLRTFINIKLNGLTVTEETKDAYIATWQLYLQPLVYPIVSENDTFDETKYPPLANALIAMLSAYSILLDKSSAGTASGTSTGSGQGGNIIKKIVTGPSEVEYQDNSNSSKTFFSEFGTVSVLQKELCTLARRLMVEIPYCPPLPKPILLNEKATSKSLEKRKIRQNSIWCSYPETLNLSV